MATVQIPDNVFEALRAQAKARRLRVTTMSSHLRRVLAAWLGGIAITGCDGEIARPGGADGGRDPAFRSRSETIAPSPASTAAM